MVNTFLRFFSQLVVFSVMALILQLQEEASVIFTSATTSAFPPYKHSHSDPNPQKHKKSAGMIINHTVYAGPFQHIYNPGYAEFQPHYQEGITDWTWYINDHTFVLGPEGRWHLFGITHTDPLDPNRETNMAHALTRSKNTSVFTSYIPGGPEGYLHAPFALGALPPETHLWAPYVLYHEGLYYMFYCGGGWNRSKSMISLATSPDLWNWTRVKVLFTGGVDGRDPMVLDRGREHGHRKKFDESGDSNADDQKRRKETKNTGGRFVIYYTGTNPDNAIINNVSHVHYCRFSDDLIHWSEEPIISFDGGYTGYNFGGPTESPFVIQRGPNSYYLFTGSWGNHYKKTRVFWSEDPTNFGSVVTGTAQHVGTIHSHAAEVVRDRHGEWYVSSCGWGQHGVYLAPLFFADGAENLQPMYPPVPEQHPFSNESPPMFLRTNLQSPWRKFTILGTAATRKFSNNYLNSHHDSLLNGSDVFLNTSSGIVLGNALHEFQFLSSTTSFSTSTSFSSKKEKEAAAADAILLSCSLTMQIITKDGNPTSQVTSDRGFFNTTASFFPYSNPETGERIAVEVILDSFKDTNPTEVPQAYLQLRIIQKEGKGKLLTPAAATVKPVDFLRQSVPFEMNVEVMMATNGEPVVQVSIAPKSPQRKTERSEKGVVMTMRGRTGRPFPSQTIVPQKTRDSRLLQKEANKSVKESGGGFVGLAIKQGSMIVNDLFCQRR